MSFSQSETVDGNASVWKLEESITTKSNRWVPGNEKEVRTRLNRDRNTNKVWRLWILGLIEYMIGNEGKESVVDHLNTCTAYRLIFITLRINLDRWYPLVNTWKPPLMHEQPQPLEYRGESTIMSLESRYNTNWPRGKGKWNSEESYAVMIAIGYENGNEVQGNVQMVR